MSGSGRDPELAAKVARIKNGALHWEKRTWQILAGLSIAGMAVGFATWFAANPRDRDGIHFGAAAALGVGTFFIGGLLSRALFPRPSAKCPQCGCDWWLESYNDIQTWLAWEFCPGCGLRIADPANMTQGPNQSLNPTGNRPAS